MESTTQLSSELQHLRDSHTPEAISQRLSDGPNHNHLRDFVYGAIDGTVTTFAVVSGVAGAGLAPGIVIVLGLANLVGDGFSMAVGNYQATRAEEQLRQRARSTEEMHIRHYAVGEQEEIRQLFQRKGFTGEDLDRAVSVITSDLKQWVDMMIREEYGLPLDGPSAWRSAAATFSAFVAVGLLPLIPFILKSISPNVPFNPFPLSIAVTASAFFAIGAAKGHFVDRRWYWSGLETLLAGGAAATLAYLVGRFLAGLV
jgi:VIT1/CCC1 family predicted Fe2+/Mn2+ transporter